jgi:hypothetical protein
MCHVLELVNQGGLKCYIVAVTFVIVNLPLLCEYLISISYDTGTCIYGYFLNITLTF